MPQFKTLQGDCKEVMATLDANSIGTIVTDPPYGLSKDPDIEEVLKNWESRTPYNHGGSGFMGKEWDSFVPNPDVWDEAYRVLKPGGYLLAFAGTRTQGLMATSIEMAGFKIARQLSWVFGCLPMDYEALVETEDGQEWVSGTDLIKRIVETGEYPSILQLDPTSGQTGFAQVRDHFIGPYPFRMTQITCRATTEDIPLTDMLSSVFGAPVPSADSDIKIQATASHRMLVGRTLDHPSSKFAHEVKVGDKLPFLNGKSMSWYPVISVTGSDLPAGTLELSGTAIENPVWCVTTSTGYFFVRVKNEAGEYQIMITGNSGFPKSLNIGKAIDKTLRSHLIKERLINSEASGKWLEENGIASAKSYSDWVDEGHTISQKNFEKIKASLGITPDEESKFEGDMTGRGKSGETAIWSSSGGMGEFEITAPATDDAKKWEGWGTALKPAYEPIIVAMKPFEDGTYPAYHVDWEPFKYTSKTAKKERNEGLPEGTNVHPTVKPVAIMEWLVSLEGLEGPFMDPFMGSGSTGKACGNTDRDFVGIEMDEEYFGISTSRVQYAYAEAEKVKQAEQSDNPWGF